MKNESQVLKREKPKESAVYVEGRAMDKSIKYQFEDVEFMTAKEKELVLKVWERFLKSLAADYDKTFVDGHGNTLPVPFSKFSKLLYQHLTLHCSYIAHYDRFGFYGTYFENPADTIQFIKQYDSDYGCISTEYGGSWWLRGDYEDLNTALCDVVNKYKNILYEKLSVKEKTDDLGQAQALAGKWGYELKGTR